ncbi:efflux RND transporter periplasmic adaptor subunit [Desulfobulbus sp. US1]|nr:efflux RND transporter periplasmic adaptor subunit [Desulfobulbus sp. US4]MCW5209191.1 efflux RND transporter periplasmic adaptor subunit [Desulfobulbus sp. US1]
MKQIGSVLLRIILCLLILVGGYIGMKKMKGLKKPPAKVERKERALAVQVVQVRAEKAPVIISGYGEVVSRTVVTLPAEVAGRITFAHKDLQAGAIIKKGEILYRINEQDFRLNLETAQARLKSLSRDLELARKEYRRVSNLYKKNKVGTQSSVEKGEQSVNAISSQMIQVEQSIAQAKLQLARCVIRAPFTGRIAELHAEQDEYVTPGKNLLTLTDDSDLEVQVSLDSRDAVDWLRFKPRKQQDSSWFGLPEKTGCTVTWTENAATRAEGRLDRVVRFDPRTRSLTVAIRLQPDTASVFPLVQGMFCRVDIEGRALDRVFILPRTAVSFEQTVYVAEENRLRTRKVEVARAEDGTAFITGGLEEGEQVIVTRLENPLESSLLNILTSAEKVEETEAVDPLEAAQKFEENKAGEQ